MHNPPTIVVLISAGAEWRAVREFYPGPDSQPSPYGEWFQASLPSPTDSRTDSYTQNTTRIRPTIFLHGGWGKIAAAASAQYAIDRWQPDLLINLGTCGGFEGSIERGEVILAETTLVYDILEQMGDPDQAIAHYTTHLDLAWLKQPYPQAVRRAPLVSADRDLLPADISLLQARYGAAAGDWESGAIAYVAARNHVRALILRGVTDLVGGSGGEAYGDFALFERAAAAVMIRLLESLPAWIRCAS
ncbi:MAG: hypothetical protein JXA78_19190 [Anaerolineales bacterium]|nr:hypothetical protein [Anaerolineales bacterium]